MNSLIRRTGLGLAAAAALVATATTTAHAAELHDLGTHDNPDYAIVFDQPATQMQVSSPNSAAGGLSCLGAQWRNTDSRGYALDAFRCGDKVKECAESFGPQDRTDTLLAVEWRPGAAGGTYSCLTWRTGDAATDLFVQAAQIVTASGG
ncbi:MAG: hypothetical protein QM747_14755 [Nocardioides sp.]